MRGNERPAGVSLHAGFPNPAGDKTSVELDLNQLLIQNSTSTYIFRLRGSEWEGYGIFDGDTAIVDRALDARKNDLVVWWNEETVGFAISEFKNTPDNVTTWGVVTSVIHRFREDTT